MDEYKKQLEKTIEIESEDLPAITDIELDTVATPQPSNNPIKPKRQIIKKGPLSKREKITFVVAVLLIIAAGAGLLWFVQQQSQAGVMETKIPKPAVKYYSPLNGVEVPDEAATKRVVTAVMIENSPDARPQSGLAEADVVFEAVAEGGITRFIALYQPSRPSIVGPVRSLRPYYADWAAGFDPSVAHVGGSPEALSMIRSGNYGVDLDEFFNSASYWRASDRYAPHNVYTNFDRLDSLNAVKKHTSSQFNFVPRVNEQAMETPDATTINIGVSTGAFSVGYDYNPSSNSYDRKQGGVAHTDREKGRISPKVVVVLKTNVSLSADGEHMNIATSGSGTAYVFQNGTVVEGVWSKAGPKNQLFIKNAEGADIKLVRGQTWITTIGNDRAVSWQ